MAEQPPRALTAYFTWMEMHEVVQLLERAEQCFYCRAESTEYESISKPNCWVRPSIPEPEFYSRSRLKCPAVSEWSQVMVSVNVLNQRSIERLGKQIAINIHQFK